MTVATIVLLLRAAAAAATAEILVVACFCLAVVCSQATYCVAGEVRPCPYAGAKFPVTMTFPLSYPFKVPEVHFLWLVHVFAFSSG